MATKVETENMEATNNEATAKKKTKEEPKIRVTIFKNNSLEEDQVVGINGKFDTIKKGVEVDLPASHVEVLRHAQEMREANRKILEAQK